MAKVKTNVTVSVTDGKITPHFMFSEFFPKQSGAFVLPSEQIGSIFNMCQLLELVRAELLKKSGKSGLTINSGWRSEQYNAQCGGIKYSNHRWDIHNTMNTSSKPRFSAYSYRLYETAELACDVNVQCKTPEEGQYWVTFIQNAANKIGIRCEVGIYTPTSKRTGFVHIGINPHWCPTRHGNWLKHNGVQTNDYYKNVVAK